MLALRRASFDPGQALGSFPRCLASAVLAFSCLISIARAGAAEPAREAPAREAYVTNQSGDSLSFVDLAEAKATSEIKIGEAVQFAKDSADLVDEGGALLGAVAKLLTEHPEITKVRVEGHTDDSGEPQYNVDLSRRRAAAVERALVARGIDPARLTSEGFGSSRPIAPNSAEEGRAQNRRVVFTILERTAAR